jgi:non-specific protein-tyrosine kinase
VIGLAVAGALIVLLEYLDDHFHSADEIAEFTGLPLLGAVRKFEGEQDEMGTVAARMPRTAIAEAYRVARANIQFADKGGDLKVILVTSARDGEGKTTTANNLATTFALAGQRVLLVDADLRRPGLTRIMNLKDSDGVSSILVDPEADVISSTDIVGLSVVPSGAIPPNPAELLGSSGMRRWIERSLENFDLIILDTPPVLSVADTRILATVADGVLLVIDPGQTTRRMVRQARLAIENVGGRVLGIMLNRDVMRGEGYYYNYYYYYGQDRQGKRQRQASK